MLRKAEASSLFQGLRITRRAPSISHLFFADDALLFFRVNPDACSHLLEVVNRFCTMSGQMVNVQKSFVKFSSNTPNDYREFLSSALHMRAQDSIGTYLVLPVDLGRAKCHQFQPLVDKVSQKLSAFSSRHLSAAVKLVLINTVVIASLNHVLSVFKLPVTIADRINRLLARFWLKNGNSNRALLAKQMWRLIHHPQLLVSRIYRARYPHLLNYKASSLPPRPSWGCRSLLDGARVHSHGVMWKMGFGSQISILDDNWVPGVYVCFKDFTSTYEFPTMVSHIIDPVSQAWDSTRIKQLFPPITADSILGMERPQEKMDDFVYWKFTRDGSFTTKSAYAHLLSQSWSDRTSSSNILPVWWRKFWGLPILPKWKLFIWKILHNALPTAAILLLKGIPLDFTCGFCHHHQETISHIFQQCEFSCLSRSSHPLVQLRTMPLDQDFNSWLTDSIMGLAVSKDWAALDSLLAFFLITRSSNVRNLSDLYQSSSPPGFSVSTPKYLGSAGSSDGYDICLTFDGAWNAKDQRAGMGWYLSFTSTSPAVWGGAHAGFASFALHSKLLACLLGLKQDREKGYSKIQVFMDCGLVCSLVWGHLSYSIAVCWTLRQIRQIIADFGKFDIQKVPR
ncbi:uncharacterized protein LOC110724055 [Chenopodium quinoa]|uniref:uncharacterized protein LOC110724055 n=1 Tax=Chenopodium quinoa TaxID=63459 RepID=UPI000B780E4E|nr:uncharacterized protein LOC110724055 [Chenopodium quinoa]